MENLPASGRLKQFIRYVIKVSLISTLVEAVSAFLKTLVGTLIDRLNEWELHKRRSDPFYDYDYYG